MLSVVVYGQTSYASLGSTSLQVEGSHINGGTGELSGGLSATGGSIRVSARRVVPFWPDPALESFESSSTSTTRISNIALEAYENLFYVRVERTSISPAQGWGQLTN